MLKNLLKLFLAVLLALACFILFMGAVKYMDNAELGYPVYPQVIAAVPAAPFACAATQLGKVIYVDDNNDTAEAYLCFCGLDADDTTPIWLKAENPATDCF
jgi:hypothetical protein